MSQRDGTGPAGLGPMTGRGMGACTNFQGLGYGYGMRRRFGRGCGWGYGLYAMPASPITLAQRKEMLEKELKHVESLLGKKSNNEQTP
jgi:hypothetical protein